jgi:hypothetical protein
MLAARLPGNSTYDNLRQAGPRIPEVASFPIAPLPPDIKGRHISPYFGHVRMAEA